MYSYDRISGTWAQAIAGRPPIRVGDSSATARFSLDTACRLCGGPAKLLIQRLDGDAYAVRQFLDVHAQCGHWRRMPKQRLGVLRTGGLVEPRGAGSAEGPEVDRCCRVDPLLALGPVLRLFCMMPARTAAGQMWRRRKFRVLMGRALWEGKINVDELVACHI